MIPQRLELSDIQAAFRDFETRFGRLLTSDIELNQRRVVGAGPSIAPFDYVTRFELDKATSALETTISGLNPDAPTALDPGLVRAIASLTLNAIILGGGGNKVTAMASLGTTATLLHGNASGAPSFAAVNLANEVGTSVLPVANGGTNIASYTVGDLLYASGATTLAKLADAATGNALLAGGAGVAPAYGKVDLTTTVTGVLPAANGGTAVAYDRISATVALTGKTTTQGPTTVASAGSQFRFSYTLLITSTDIGAATVTVSVNYTDDIVATSQAGVAVAVTANNRQTGTFIIQRASGNVTYTVTVTGVIGTAVFAFYATLERLS